MNNEVIEAWRTIYSILQLTGYDRLYEEEVNVMVNFIREHINESKGE